MQFEPVKSLIILGGGTSGWISAVMLKKVLGDSCDITVIESPAIGRIGVGEASVPSLKEEVFDFLGIPESEWMPACQGTYKLGIKFVGWNRASDGSSNDFYHLFGEVPDVQKIPLTHYWLKKRFEGFDGPIDKSIYTAFETCARNRSPRYSDGSESDSYAYHFDAQKVADFLSGWAVKRGVKHVQGKIAEVRQDERGWVSGLVTDDGTLHSADMYLDCSGFRGVLINETLGEPFISFKENLLIDRAVSLNRVHKEGQELEPYSTATALSSGWCWKIPLRTRTGNGYVYSSQFLTEEEAEAEFRRYLGVGPDEGTCRHFKLRVGRTRNGWVKNVVSVGLSYSFLEPLESTGIYSTYAAIHQLIRNFPDKSMDQRTRDHFNERMAFMVDDIRDFIVMHYVITSRNDSPFWRACQNLPISDSLREVLGLYKSGMPVKVSYSGSNLYKQFDASFDRFWTNSNYLAILVGMGIFPERPMPLLNYMGDAIEEAEALFAKIKTMSEDMAQTLPTHREYLESQGSLTPEAEE